MVLFEANFLNFTLKELIFVEADLKISILNKMTQLFERVIFNCFVNEKRKKKRANQNFASPSTG